VQLMLMHHALDAEDACVSVDTWLKEWPQHMAVYVDVNRYCETTNAFRKQKKPICTRLGGNVVRIDWSQMLVREVDQRAQRERLRA
jgi:hypothetical protein